MRRAVVLGLIASFAVSTAASGQSVSDTRYVPAPWWMREPVVASIGYVRTEIEANRAYLGASFQVVDSNPAKATEKAAAKIRELGAALQRIGGDNIRVQTTFSTMPLYEQYRDKDGNLLENRRADKIERYQVSANVSIEVRDTNLVQRVYSTVVAAQPSSTNPVSFRLEPTNEAKTRLYEEALKDAVRRARSAVEAAGGRLGAPKVIDPTGRVCETDVLALRPAVTGEDLQPTDVDGYAVTGSRVQRQAFESISPVAAPAPPPPPGAELEAAGAALQLTIQPPLQPMTARACVIYAMG